MGATVSAPPYLAYARSVVAGKTLASRLVCLACERHLRDLKEGKRRGLWFDEDAADHAIRFFSFLRHSKGEWAGAELKLEQWQQFLVASLFGWKRADGLRRFRIGYVEVAKKNGKSTLLAGIGLYLFVPAGDGEPGAEVYSAATKRDQAKIVWGEAKRMVEKSPALRKKVGICGGDRPGQTANLHIAETASKFEPLSSDHDTQDGLNIHGAIIDELHAHRTRDLWDILEGGGAARRQPLYIAITTAGYDRQSICYEQHEYGRKVLEGVVEDDTYFCFIAALDGPRTDRTVQADDPAHQGCCVNCRERLGAEHKADCHVILGDDWRNEKLWIKANPNLGVSVKLDDLRRLAKKAMETPAAQNAFRRLRLNEWTEQDSRWMDISSWEACAFPVDADELRGRPCFGGLDLSTTRDLTAFVLFFPPEDEEEKAQVLAWFWVPEDNIIARVRKDRVPYNIWAEQGYITPTPGAVVDYDIIRETIKDVASSYLVQEIAFDRYNATQLVTQLMGDGLTMVPMGQGPVSMSMPIKQLEKLILGKKIAHGGNPVLRWNFSNVVAVLDGKENVCFDKKRARERFDGIQALAMATGRAQIVPVEPAPYADEGIFFA